MKTLILASVVVLSALGIGTSALIELFAVPEIQLPGTQPLEVAPLGTPNQCDNCHGGYDPAVEPARNWRGGMMAQAGRDPLFWATLAVAEQDFAGVGDLCLRCHAPRGWLEGRSTQTDGSGLAAGDGDGVECSTCHQLTDPDGSEIAGVQNIPYLANDGGVPPEAYLGSGMMVIHAGGARLGPYADAYSAPHAFLPSRFHRSKDFCGTCHDVSNSLVGDLAHNHGAQVPLPPGTFSGVPGTAVATKAAFNNFPFAYGIVERTFSEFRAGALDDYRVADYAQLPAELRGGVLARVYQQSQAAGRGGDYADGAERTFTCQSCHLSPTVGKGCDRNNAPIRSDLPHHDLTGGNYWVPDAILHLDAQNELPLGGGLTSLQVSALLAGKARALATLSEAAALSVQGNVVKVVNRTGHKLITGYPEGRRMWLRTKWYGPSGQLLREDGRYGSMVVQIGGAPVTIETILDLDDPNTRIYEAHYGLTQEWAAELVQLGIPATLPLGFDRLTGQPTLALGDLAASPAGTTRETFHFVLNNAVLSDNRIPPYGMRYDEARSRNTLPVPATQYGNPGPGGIYAHYDEVLLDPPTGAQTATIDLLYQPTSFEYIQFLRLANTGTSAFLADSGEDILNAWLATGMAAPHVMATTSWSTPGPLATVLSLGTGCGAPPHLPTLSATRPAFGQTTLIELLDATPSTNGLLVFSLPPMAPVPLGYGCSIWVDLASYSPLAPIATDPLGAWNLAIPIPWLPAATGFTVVFQAVTFGSSGPLGVDVTNGLLLTLGY